MDEQLVMLADVAGSTVVALLATDAWQTARSAMGSLWRRVHPDRGDATEAELTEARAELVDAHRHSEKALADALTIEWQQRIRRLLATEPGIEAELRRLLRDELEPALGPGAGTWHGSVTQRASAHDQGRIYQVAQGEMTIRHDD
ncbi:hypothetical protein ACFY3U_11690 [Micromonospora sp. NPDC000089]|uniref:hypothetical protein n=1 Tax=unclassified Micromonospora TaxID=2617518 RepID=UPI0036AF4D79